MRVYKTIMNNIKKYLVAFVMMLSMVGFVGCGNMATAIIGGILEKGILKKEDIKASTKTENSAKKVQETLGIECTTDNKKAVQDADVIF